MRALLATLMGLGAFVMVATAGTPQWDARLDELKVSLVPAADCSGGCWRLVEAYYLDPDESAGLHHVFGKALDAEGAQLAGVPLVVAWAEGSTSVPTKPAPDLTDIALWDCYFPEQGPGGYRAYVGGDERNSDVVAGMGLPSCYHVSFRLVWQWQDAPPAPLPHSVYLPLVAAP